MPWAVPGMKHLQGVGSFDGLPGQSNQKSTWLLIKRADTPASSKSNWIIYQAFWESGHPVSRLWQVLPHGDPETALVSVLHLINEQELCIYTISRGTMCVFRECTYTCQWHLVCTQGVHLHMPTAPCAYSGSALTHANGTLCVLGECTYTCQWHLVCTQGVHLHMPNGTLCVLGECTYTCQQHLVCTQGVHLYQCPMECGLFSFQPC